MPSVKGQLKPADKVECVVLPTRISYKEVRGLFENEFETGLLPGIYRATEVDAEGTFYRGEGRPFFERIDSMKAGEYIVHRGGVWLPKAADRKPSLYFIKESMIYKTSNLDLFEKSGAPLVGSPLTSPGTTAATAVGGAFGALMGTWLDQLGNEEPELWLEVSDESFTEQLLKSLKTGAETNACRAVP